MTAVVDTSPAQYHKQSSRYHYQVPPEEDDLESQPSVPRVIQTAVGPKQPEWKKIQQKTFTNWVNERLVLRERQWVDCSLSECERRAKRVMAATSMRCPY